MHYRDLEVWQVSMDLAEEVYHLTETMPSEEKFALTRQIRESAASISANISEGSGRGGTGELIYFLGVANGSRCEMESRLILASRLKYVGDIQEILDRSTRVGMMLLKLIGVLKARKTKKSD
jgi:four helix bundle protein